MNIEEAIDKVDRFVNTITVILPKYSTAIPEYCIDEESWLAIKKVLKAYEKEKEANRKLDKEAQGYLEELAGDDSMNIRRIQELEAELEKEKEKNKNAIDFINERKKTVNKDMAEGTRLQVGTFMWQVDELLEILKGVEEE